MTDRLVAIVTGGSRGIGNAVAKELAQMNYDLVINHFDFTSDGRPDESKAKQTGKEIEASGERCEIFRGDISRG